MRIHSVGVDCERRSAPSFTHAVVSMCIVWLTLFAASAVAAPKVEDTMAQRVQACTGCHGPQGRAASDGYYPRIAGKPAGYLYNQLISFRDGRRQYALMANLLAPLTDDYLREIAEHFSSLELPYPPPQPATDNVDALTRGETLVLRGDAALKVPACVQCHGAALMGVAPSIPALIGMPRDYLNAQLGGWRTGARHAASPDCMAHVAQRLAPQDIAALSQWLAAQTVPPLAKPASSLPATLPEPCGGVADTATATSASTPTATSARTLPAAASASASASASSTATSRATAPATTSSAGKP